MTNLHEPPYIVQLSLVTLSTLGFVVFYWKTTLASPPTGNLIYCSSWEKFEKSENAKERERERKFGSYQDKKMQNCGKRVLRVNIGVRCEG
jgi:hypothetical protein